MATNENENEDENDDVNIDFSSRKSIFPTLHERKTTNEKRENNRR